MDLTKLDKVFSEYIRQRDADSYGRVKCCTCDTVAHWCEMDAGHYVSRVHLATRWEEKNCHSQCISCNRTKHGNMNVYDKYIIERYNLMTPRSLRMEARTVYKPMQHEIDEMVQEYREKIRQL